MEDGEIRMMRALSLWQPWASAMYLGLKANETRSWPTSYRGDLAICAAKRKMTFLERELYVAFVAPATKNTPHLLPYGCVLCVVELYDCMASESFLFSNITPGERALGNYSAGRWVWCTHNLRPLKQAIPIVGRQGLWKLTPEEETAVRAQL